MAMPFCGALLQNSGEYAMYRAGKLAAHPNSLALYIASPQTRSSEIAVLLQDQPSTNFAWGVSGLN